MTDMPFWQWAQNDVSCRVAMGKGVGFRMQGSLYSPYTTPKSSCTHLMSESLKHPGSLMNTDFRPRCVDSSTPLHHVFATRF